VTCPELVRHRRAITSFDLYRFHRLHLDGQRLISGWFKRAWDMRDCEAEEGFEPFIFLWLAFNGWAACVSGRDMDREWRDALALNPTIQGDFARLVADSESSVAVYALEFHRTWPIFKAQAIRRQGVYVGHEWSRQEVIEHYLSNGINRFEPQCGMRHRAEETEIPLDWPHTLAALYRVRCNLFHGEKAAHSEMDQLIVANAFRVLVHFLHGSGYLARTRLV
jgi:hypothetical protein